MSLNAAQKLCLLGSQIWYFCWLIVDSGQKKKIPTSISYWNWYPFPPNRVCRVWYVKVNLIIRWNNNKRSKNTDISILNNSPGTEVGICFHCGGFNIATKVNQSYGKLHCCAVHSTNSKVFWTDFRQLFLQCTFSSVSKTTPGPRIMQFLGLEKFANFRTKWIVRTTWINLQ